MTIFHLSEGQYSSCDPTPTLELRHPQPPLMELSAEKFWAFSGKKSTQCFKGVCFVFQKCCGEKKKKGQRERKNQKMELCKSTPQQHWAGIHENGAHTLLFQRVPKFSKELLQSFCRLVQLHISQLHLQENYEALFHFPPPVQRHKQIPVSI